MSLYSTYNSITEKYISNSSEAYFESDIKAQAINEVIRELLREYDIPEMIKRAEITFDANGLASLPADYFKMVKLWETDASGVQQSKYEWLDPADFDSKSSTSSYWYTEDYIVADSERKLKVLPTDSGTLDIRYLVTPGTVDTSDTTDSKLSSYWDEVIAAGTAKKLFEWAARWDEVPLTERAYNKLKKTTYLSLKNRGGWDQHARHRSVFERKSYLDR